MHELSQKNLIALISNCTLFRVIKLFQKIGLSNEQFHFCYEISNISAGYHLKEIERRITNRKKLKPFIMFL